MMIMNKLLYSRTVDVSNLDFNGQYKFNNTKLLRQALTHSSYKRENEVYDNGDASDDNERLEFLGDAILDLVIGDILFKSMPDEKEGNLSKIRAGIVCEESLAKIADILDISQLIILGRGELKSGGRNKSSILADAVEAIIGAIYLDSDYYTCYDFVATIFDHLIVQAENGMLNHDYKSLLQEKLQKDGSVDIKYMTYKEEGPDHKKTFYVKVFCGSKKLGIGSGRSKKIAQQEAAKDAMLKGI